MNGKSGQEVSGKSGQNAIENTRVAEHLTSLRTGSAAYWWNPCRARGVQAVFQLAAR